MKKHALLTVVLAAALCSACSLKAGVSSTTKDATPALAGERTSTSAPPPTPYVCRVRDIMNSSFRKHVRFQSSGADLRTEVIGNISCTPAYRETRLQELNRQLNDIEKVRGQDSLALVPVLVRIALVYNDEAESSRCIKRALSIAENASPKRPTAEEATTAAQALEMTSSLPVIRDLPIDQTRLLKCVFLLKLEAEGFNSGNYQTLLALTSSLNKKSGAAESCQLLELVIGKTGYLVPYDEPLKATYKEALLSAGRNDEAKVVEAELEARKKQRVAEIEQQLEKALEQARIRAEIDPYGLVQAELRLATFQSGEGDRKSALSHFSNVCRNYGELQPSGDNGELDRELKDWFRSLLRAGMALDDQTIYSFVDACEERDARTHSARSCALEAMKENFSGAKCMELLQHVLDKRRQMRPHDTRAIERVSGELARLYIHSGESAPLVELQKSTLEDAETRFGKDDPRLIPPLVDLADVYHKQGRDEDALPLMDQAASLVDRLKPNGYPFPYIQHMVYFYARRDQLAKADRVLRLGYRLLQQAGDESGLPSACLNDALRSLIEKYQHSEDYEKAESMIGLARENCEKLYFDRSWIGRLNNIYLAHAVQLKEQGKPSQARKVLALSDTELEKALKRNAQNCKNSGTPYSDERPRKERRKMLKERGLYF